MKSLGALGNSIRISCQKRGYLLYASAHELVWKNVDNNNNNEAKEHKVDKAYLKNGAFAY